MARRQSNAIRVDETAFLIVPRNSKAEMSETNASLSMRGRWAVRLHPTLTSSQ
jgi:hypothetical protein